MTANHDLTHAPIFWRDARMPHVELRQVIDGRNVCYALHSHTQWSLGAVTEGESTFLYRNNAYHVKKGDLVLMNPDWPHACNPIDDKPWAYLMLYVDTMWLTQLRYAAGLLKERQWHDIANAVVTDPQLYQSFCTMTACLLDSKCELLYKQTQVVEYLSDLMQTLSQRSLQANIPTNIQSQSPNLKNLNRLSSYLDEHCREEVSLDDLCVLSDYSPSHLIRVFKQHFGITPHAYLINRRIQYSQLQLKKGMSIADTALNAGFADQAHFQRTFKRLVAATPNQYRQQLIK